MPNFARKPWRDYTAVPGHQGSDEAVVDLTGWSPATLDVMWEAYRDVLPSTKARKGTKQAYFFLAYRFIKLGPRVRELYSVLHTPETGHVGKKAFYKHVAPILIALAENADMIHWGNRLASDNHCFVFPVGVTGIVDCFPIRVLTPRDYKIKKLLNQPKYKSCVFKVQLVISLKGRCPQSCKQHLSSSPFVCIGEIIFASFPHLGVDHDSKIWRTSLAQGLMTFVNNEWILSDPAYVGCRHAAVKYSKKKLCGIFSPCQGNAPGRRSCSCPVANTPFEVQVTIT